MKLASFKKKKKQKEEESANLPKTMLINKSRKWQIDRRWKRRDCEKEKRKNCNKLKCDFLCNFLNLSFVKHYQSLMFHTSCHHAADALFFSLENWGNLSNCLVLFETAWV
jgi:hypothetical protein